MSEFVVNLHVTERCNYGCTFCFGKWGLDAAKTEIFEDAGAGEAVIRDLFAHFGGRPDGIRFNFVGGEPALLKRLPELVALCRELGARVSYVSNGLMLRRFDVAWTAANVDLVGISVDSLVDETNRRIGRLDKHQGMLDRASLYGYVSRLREIAAARIKVNTVVCLANHDEDLSPLIDAVRPDRWKIFQVLPVYGEREAVTPAQFSDFLDRHQRFGKVIVSEDNDEMTGSYVMVDPMGRFFWHVEGRPGYRYSRPISEVGVAAAFAAAGISWEKYSRRYRQPE
ncbi:viperin family antiviral radical SAM protein [Catellatospora paridis]|uniref:viperin family antiviral radical SAM protein n=1 Tax=Catellatospora paridis TaxID=1617086 RepID=UPI0012D42618|nr:viperin family antiviral radical SAM protein [Catellatospora paridis]